MTSKPVEMGDIPSNHLPIRAAGRLCIAARELYRAPTIRTLIVEAIRHKSPGARAIEYVHTGRVSRGRPCMFHCSNLDPKLFVPRITVVWWALVADWPRRQSHTQFWIRAGIPWPHICRPDFDDALACSFCTTLLPSPLRVDAMAVCESLQLRPPRRPMKGYVCSASNISVLSVYPCSTRAWC